ncbi:MAG: GNAT family N-acetyltransferase [Bacteroidota bacterium]
MNTKAIIRNVKETDKQAVIHLLRLNTPLYFSPVEEKDLIDYLNHHAENYYIVEYDNTIAGCGGFNLSDDLTIGKISWDIFHPDYQSKGLGSLLLRYRIEKLKEYKNIQTITVRTSQLAHKFYSKNRFQLKEIVMDYWAPGFDLYRMQYLD